MSAKIVTRPHPFSIDRVESEAPSGTLIRDVVGDGFAFSLNGEPADPGRALADGDLLVAVAVPAGSNPKETGNKIGGWSIVAILGAIAILVFAPVAIAWLGGVLLTAGAAGVLTGVALTQGWFDLAGKSGEAAETLPGLRGARNRANPWGAVPVILGRHRLAPFYAATPYTEISGTDGETQYLNILFCVGYGPLKITQARIGESLLASNAADVRNGSIAIDGVYSDVSLEIRTTGDVTLFPANVREEPVGIELKYNAPIVRMTPDKTTAIDVDIAFPVGLLQYDSEGDKQSATVNVKAEYRPAGGSWSDFPGSWSGTGFDVTKTKNRTMRFKMSKTGLTAGKYEVRVTRLTVDATDSKVVDRVQILAVRSWFADLPLAAAIRDKTVRMGLRIKATDQLQGVVDQFSVLAESVLPDYDGTGSGVSEWPAAVTANPASCALALLRGPASPNPVGDSLINWAAFEAFHAWCDTKDFECSAVISDQASLGELLTRVLMTGRAALDIYGGQYSVSFDGPKTTPVQQFTPRNSSEFSGTKNMEEAPHALRVGYLSEEADYTAEELIVYRDGYTDVTATKFEDVSLWGVTRHDQAYKAARYMLACRLLRPELWQIKVDAEYLVCRRGDLVRFSHDVLLVGIAAGRIKALTTGTGTITGFSSDEVLPMETGKSYAVRIRRADSTPLYVPVNTVVGDQTTVVFTTPIADTSGVAAGDLFSFGEAGSETIEALVAAIEPGEDLSATLTLVDYAPDVQTADSGTIPAYDPHVTLPPAAVLLNAMTQVQAAETGTLISERPPEGVSPTYSEVEGMVGGGSVPPDNNVTSVAFSSSQNADGSIHIEFSAAYSQGTNKADGVFIYYKSALSAPGAFDLALDKAEWKQIALTDTSVGHGFDVPARTGGTGGAPLHYRFGAVAGMGSKLHTSGVVTPTGWDDKTFTATIDGTDVNLYDKALTAYEGSGATRRAVRVQGDAVKWLDAPDGGSEEEVAQVRRFDFGEENAAILYGAFFKNGEAKWLPPRNPCGFGTYQTTVAPIYYDGKVHHFYRNITTQYLWESEIDPYTLEVIQRQVTTSVCYSAIPFVHPTKGVMVLIRDSATNPRMYKLSSGAWMAAGSALSLTSIQEMGVFIDSNGDARAVFVQFAGGIIDRIWYSSTEAWAGSSGTVQSGSTVYYPDSARLGPIATDGYFMLVAKRQDNSRIESWIFDGSSWGTAQDVVVAASIGLIRAAFYPGKQPIVGYVYGSGTYIGRAKFYNGSAWGSEETALDVTALARGLIQVDAVLTEDGTPHLFFSYNAGTGYASRIYHCRKISGIWENQTAIDNTATVSLVGSCRIQNRGIFLASANGINETRVSVFSDFSKLADMSDVLRLVCFYSQESVGTNLGTVTVTMGEIPVGPIVTKQLTGKKNTSAGTVTFVLPSGGYYRVFSLRYGMAASVGLATPTGYRINNGQEVLAGGSTLIAWSISASYYFTVEFVVQRVL